MDTFRFDYPLIFLFSWNQHNARLISMLQNLPANIISISPTTAPSIIGQMSNPEVVACVFVLSPDAFMDPLFEQALLACRKELSYRKEFRLFVHLSDISRQQLIEMAHSNPTAADLLDSVHIGESSSQDQTTNLIQSVEQYLRQLPVIQDYLKYEQWKRISIGVVPLLSLAFLVFLGVGWIQLAMHTQETLESDLLPWILVTIGATFYSSFLAVFSFGSTLQTGSFLRWGMALFPLWIISSIPSSKLVDNWLFLIAGFCVGFLMDLSRRMWAQFQREQIPVTPPEDDGSESGKGIVGKWRFQMLTTTPVLSADPSVFISYSRASLWGSSTASALHKALKSNGIPCFLDAENIAEGTSWRHKIQQAIGKASVIVSVQDSITAPRHWPSAELNAAIRSQKYCGLPSIIILRDATLASGTCSSNQVSLLDTLLTQRGEVDPTLLRIIDFKPDTPTRLAGGLSNFEPASIINPTLGAILRYFLVPIRVALAALGAVGPGVSTFSGIVWFVSHLAGINVVKWLNESGLSIPTMLLAAFWLGFVIRLVFASRFELRVRDAHHVFWYHLGVVFVLLWILRYILPTQAHLSILFASTIVGFGFLLACDFVSKSLPASNQYRPPPD
jgi:hypothetical protein